MKTRNEVLGILVQELGAWPTARPASDEHGFLYGTGWRWNSVNGSVVVSAITHRGPSEEKISYADWLHALGEPAPMPAKLDDSAPPVPPETALKWLVDNVKSWPVELDIMNPQDAPHGWYFTFWNIVGVGPAAVLKSNYFDGVTIGETEWRKAKPAKPAVTPEVGQWYAFSGDKHQVQYVGSNLIVLCDEDGDEDTVYHDEFSDANPTPCERPKTKRELVLDEFNEWRALEVNGGFRPVAMDDAENTKVMLPRMLDFIVERDGK